MSRPHGVPGAALPRQRPLSIAVAQTIPVRGEVEANLEQHLRQVAAAAESQAEVLVFPELSLTGYELEHAQRLAFSERDPRLEPLLAAAAEHSVTLVVGAPIRLGARLHIGAFILSPGRRVEIYTKRHLGAFSSHASRDGEIPPPESAFFECGDRDPLLRLGDEVAAVAICADTGRPAHPRQAAERGASVYLASMFVIPSDFERETGNLRDCAARHRMVVAFANYGGASGGLASAGRSAIWSETGGLLVQLGPSGAGVAVAIRSDSGWRASVS